MKRIKLSQQGKNKGRFVALVDDEDFEFLNSTEWSISIRDHTSYASRNLIVNERRKTLKMHRAILGEKCNGHLVDHIDGNGLNNQKSNLRICTNHQNTMNSRPNKNTSSIYKGVTWHKKNKKWRSQIRFNFKYHNIGSFINEIDAANEYDKRAKELFGEFAYLNFKLK